MTWLAVMAVSLVYAIKLVAASHHRYYSNPTVVVLERDHREWNVSFPALTFCLLNRTNGTRARQLVLQRWGNVSKTQMDKYMRFVQAVVEASHVTLHQFQEFENDSTVEDIAVEMPNISLQVQVDLRGRVPNFGTNQSLTVTPVLIEHGMCYSVGSVMAPYLSPVPMESGAMPQAKQKPHTCVPHYDCTGTLHVFYSAAKVFVHSPYEVPEANSYFYFPKGGDANFLEYSYQELITSDAVRLLPRSQRHCYLLDEVDDVNMRINSYNICIMLCRRRMAFALCGCVPFYYVFGGPEYKVCSAGGLACLSKRTEELGKLKIEGKAMACNCSHPCDQLVFTEEKLEKYEEFQSSNISSVSWSLTIFPTVRWKRDLVFRFEDLLVSYGGILGLFLGCSVLSVVEAFYYLSLRAAYARRRAVARRALLCHVDLA